MAPLIKTTIGLLLGYLYTKSPQSFLEDKDPYARINSDDENLARQSSISVISQGLQQIDVYGVDRKTGKAAHKWWDGSQWNPRGSSMELLAGELTAAPSAVSSNKNIMDVFSTNIGKLLYKKFDGDQWQPGSDAWRDLGSDGVLFTEETLSVTSAVPGRLDVFGYGDGLLAYHKYYNGSDWMPDGDIMDDLGGSILIQGAPVALSWPSGCHAVIAIGASGKYLSRFFDGSTWSEWQGTPLYGGVSDPTATSWGEKRIDLFAVYNENLFYSYCRAGTWSDEVSLSEEDTPLFEGKPAAFSFIGPDPEIGRIDVFVRGVDGQYYHIHGDGFDWSAWSCHGGNFSSAPEIVSPVNNATQRLDVFGVTSDDELVHQMWDGQVWYPGLDQWETLGSGLQAF